MIDLAGIVILAGGESTRMGLPKALLKLTNGETLIDFHICHAKALSNKLSSLTKLKLPVMLADNGKRFYQPNYLEKGKVILIDDYVENDETGKGAGALSAIVMAMQEVIYPNDYLMVICCDSLINATQLYDKLFNQITDKNEDVVYFKGEKDYPLLGLYRVDLLPKLKVYLDKGNRAVMKFLKDKKVKTVGLPNEWVNLANFNTLDEFNLALKQLNELG